MSTTTPHHLTPATGESPIAALLTLQTQWYTTKRSSPLLKRLGMRSVEVIAFAAAMLVAPLMIHNMMLCFNEFNDFMGRSARSPYTQTPWGSLLFAFVSTVGWGVVLGRLGYSVDLEERGTGAQRRNGSQDHFKERRVSWGRILGRIVIPLSLIALTVHVAMQASRRASEPMPFIIANTISRADVEAVA